MVDILKDLHEMDDVKKIIIIDENVVDTLQSKKTHFLKSQEGNLLALASAMCISLGGVFYKKAESMNGSDNSIFRYIIQLITMVAILKCKGIALFGPKDQRNLLFLRAFFGIFAVVFANFAIKYIDPSDNVSLSHTNIILTAVVARIILKEKLGVQHLVALVMTITGVLLITKPSFLFQVKHVNGQLLTNQSTTCFEVGEISLESDPFRRKLIGVGFALVGACGSAAIHVIVKKLCINKVYFAVTTLYGTFLGLPASILTSMMLIVTGVDHKNFECELKRLPYDFVYGLVGGGFAVIAHVLFNLSLKHEDATKVATLRTIDVLFSFIFQYFLLGIDFNLISLAGALLITLATLIILVVKHFEEK